MQKIRSNRIHPNCGALPVPYLPVQELHALFNSNAHRYSLHLLAADPHITASFIPLSISLELYQLSEFDGVRLAGFESGTNASLLTLVAFSKFVSFNIFLPLNFFLGLILWTTSGLMWCQCHFLSLAFLPLLIIIMYIK